MKKSDIIKELSMISGDPDVRFAFSNSENADGNIWTYSIDAIDELEMVDEDGEDTDETFICIMTNEDCIEDIDDEIDFTPEENIINPN